MILVDTSVLISFLSGTELECTNKLEYVISNNIPFGINCFIYQELLQGTKTEKEFNLLKDYLDTQKFYELLYGRQSYANAAEIYYKCRKKGVTVRSTIDLLIVETALENNLYLLHNDSDYKNIAKVIKDLNFY